jgi:hypothetical protein
MFSGRMWKVIRIAICIDDPQTDAHRLEAVQVYRQGMLSSVLRILQSLETHEDPFAGQEL